MSTAVRVSEYQVRYPDLGVDCGRFLDEELAADAPRLVFEVLSATTRAFDLVRKVEEYKSVPSLRHIVLVDTGEPKFIQWSRQDGGSWAYRTVEGFGATIEIADPGISLALGVLYKGLNFVAKPRLIIGDDPPATED